MLHAIPSLPLRRALALVSLPLFAAASPAWSEQIEGSGGDLVEGSGEAPASPGAAPGCWPAATAVAVNEALRLRVGPAGAAWRAETRTAPGAGCEVWLVGEGAALRAGVDAAQDVDLVAAELAWRLPEFEQLVSRTAALGATAALRAVRVARTVAALASIRREEPAPAPRSDVAAEAGRAVPSSGAAIDVTVLNGDVVGVVRGRLGFWGTSMSSAGLAGWVTLSEVPSQYVWQLGDAEVRGELRVAGLAGSWVQVWPSGLLHLSVEGQAGATYARAEANELVAAAESAWMPEATLLGRLEWPVGPARFGVEAGYRVVAGDEIVVGPERWALTGPLAGLSFVWERP
jgi:hypothetical protein